MARTTTHLLYLHGFRSSPRSTKAQKMAAAVRQQHPGVTWWCPQLPPSPALAIHSVLAGTAHWPAAHMAVVGSSLGGFYATYVAAQRACPAVLLNPAVFPARDLAQYIGEQGSWHDSSERFFFEPQYVQELQALTLPAAQPLPPCLAVIAKGDELLDWREMQARYPQARVKLLPGSDHALSDFDQHLDEIFAFLQLL